MKTSRWQGILAPVLAAFTAAAICNASAADSVDQSSHLWQALRGTAAGVAMDYDGLAGVPILMRDAVDSYRSAARPWPGGIERGGEDRSIIDCPGTQ